jgi:hypothetical protein
MKTLSKLFFGSASRAEKLVEKGRVIQEKDSQGDFLTNKGVVKSTLQRLDGRGLLTQLRAAKIEFDAQQAARRKAEEAMVAAKEAMGSSGAAT